MDDAKVDGTEKLKHNIIIRMVAHISETVLKNPLHFPKGFDILHILKL